MPFNDVVKAIQRELVLDDALQIRCEGCRQALDVRFEIGTQIENVVVGQKDATAVRSLRKIVQ